MDNKDRYTLIKRGPGSYFIGSNTADGFRISPDPALSEENCSRMMILKGGPGTGKSTVMKRFSNRAAALGYSVTEYYCSSDPSSLDAVRAESGDRSIVVCDGTSPHVTEMKYPGAVSEIFDLSSSWNVSMLIPKRDEIVHLAENKKKCFERAAKALRAAREAANIACGIGREALDGVKLERFASRTASKIRPDGGGRKEVITSALSMNGAVTLDTYLCNADEIFCVEDCYSTSGLVLKALSDALAERGVYHEAALCPEDHTVYEALFINGISRLYTARFGDPGAKSLKCARFVTPDVKSHRQFYRFSKKCSDSLTSLALSELSEAKKYHFALENIYTPSVDFDDVAARSGSRIFSLL